MGILENFFCKRVIQERDTAQKSSDDEAVRINSLVHSVDVLEQQNAAVIKAAQEERKQNLQTISDLTGNVADLTSEVEDLKTQAKTKSLYAQPCPAMLQEVDGNKVMLGQFTIRTAQGSFTITYPNHPSTFVLSPIFETILNIADCNRKRSDLTSVQICTAIANAKLLNYVADQTQWGNLDNWTPANIVYFLGSDDCESEAQMKASAMKYYEMKYGVFQDITVCTGYGHYLSGNQWMGHGFVLLVHNTSTDLKDSFIIEATLSYKANAMSLAEAKNSYQADWGVIGFTRTDHPEGTYWFKNEFAWWGTTAAAVRETNPIKLLWKRLTNRSRHRQKRENLHETWKHRRIE